MFLPFFEALRAVKIPVSLHEYLTFLRALSTGVVLYDVEGFYFLARASFVKDERHIDRFDRAFSAAFENADDSSLTAWLDSQELPADWLKKWAEENLSPEDRAQIDAMGGFDKLMDSLRQRLEEQKKRHQGGNKWIGTAGTSPFGAYGYNPEGVRIGQDRSRHQKATKVWDRREFADLDDQVELGTRNIKIALKRLREWARDGANQELDVSQTIRATAESGFLDIQTRPERHNAVKILLLLDIGGSMDAHISQVEKLFSAARSEFKYLERYYFHNCIYEALWQDNRRRWDETTPTWEILHRYGSDYKCIIVGDASMSPYEISMPGGANEYWNQEAGHTWLTRLFETWPQHLWINPVPQDRWSATQSIGMVQSLLGQDRMVPMTLSGIDQGMRILTK